MLPSESWMNSPHRRWNPLRGEWVLVSPQRTQRPWQGQTEAAGETESPAYDPQCYLCPGNMRAGGIRTPEYTGTFVFTNDYAALNPDVSENSMDVADAGLLRSESEKGICRVLCFDPRHDLTLATMPVGAIRQVIEEWAHQELELGALPEIGYVQIFENRGAMMGASNPHPHGQIWATQHLPNEPAAELRTQTEHFKSSGTSLLLDYLELELKQQERIVVENERWVALVPFWAVWPFEIMLIPRHQVSRLLSLDETSREDLAAILKQVTAGYNEVFKTPFPYSMGFHPAPSDGTPHPEWQLHAHFFPPLLRSASVKKFMVGFELLGSPQRDITPESAAATLRGAVAAAAK